MAIENVELMHENSPEHLSMGTARLKEGKETGRVMEERVKMERSKRSMKTISPEGTTIE